MIDWFHKQGGRERRINWLGLDAWIDSNLAETWESLKNAYSAAASFFARFRLTGVKRLLNEGASEAMTMGAGGLVVMYALALPAFVEIEEGRWLNTGKYSVKFLDSSGNEIGKRGINLNDAVPLEEIPDHLIKATLATEDRRFFEHFGVDFLGTARALVENMRANDVVQGGSSLTQQLAKNLFLSSERSLTRKIKEMFLAFWLESRLSKREILKLYLDRAYLGGGAFGVEAGSQFYFGKSVREMTMAESAVMAGLFKAPTRYAPHINLPAARARASEVLDNLVEAGFYTAGQVHQARLYPAKIVENRETTSPDYYLDWAYEEIQRVMEGRGHFVVTARTTFDPTLQQAADNALTSTIRQYGRSHNTKAGAMVAMEPGGAVRALVGGLDYGESQFNRATTARRQPGSSFKLYVYAAALENGYNPRSTVRDSSGSCGNWSPSNYNGGGGSGRSLSMTDAFKVSLNTTAADLSFKVGRDKVLEMTQRLGVVGVKRTCSMALGDTGITPLEHTGAYATFANGGKRVRPYAILEVFNSKGDLVYSRDKDEPEPPQIVAKRVVEGMNQMMQAVVLDGTGKRAALDFTHAVGKTGTSSSYRDAWFMGFTGAYVTGVWLGNDDYRPTTKPGGGGVTGGSLPAIAWHSFMSVAHTDMNVPTILGLPPHPTQVAEQQRIAEAKRNNPALAATASAIASQAKRNGSIMPDQTREALKRLAQAMRKAGGGPADAPMDSGLRPPAPAPASPAMASPDRRAENAAPAPGPAQAQTQAPRGRP